jgi:hypothetical protein
MAGCSSLSGSERPMLNERNADRGHHIPKMAFEVPNAAA